MIQRNLLERFCIFWYTNDEDSGLVGQDFVQQIAELTGWPVPIETDNVEIWQGGGA